jgi:predicted outer membrane protein
MKKQIVNHVKILVINAILFSAPATFAQQNKDTINPGRTNDPMVVHPGDHKDDIAVNPGRANDRMAVLTDTGFISKNIADNLLEIKLINTALSKGTGAQIKKVATRMLTDHNAILADLRKLQTRTGATESILATPMLPPMAAEQLQGEGFNAKWASVMLTMHQAKVAELEKYLAATRNPQLKAVIGMALPKIRAHRKLLEEIPGAKVVAGPNSVIH